jgi:hypothetical protein
MAKTRKPGTKLRGIAGGRSTTTDAPPSAPIAYDIDPDRLAASCRAMLSKIGVASDGDFGDQAVGAIAEQAAIDFEAYFPAAFDAFANEFAIQKLALAMHTLNSRATSADDGTTVVDWPTVPSDANVFLDLQREKPEIAAKLKDTMLAMASHRVANTFTMKRGRRPARSAALEADLRRQFDAASPDAKAELVKARRPHTRNDVIAELAKRPWSALGGAPQFYSRGTIDNIISPRRRNSR